MAKRSSDHELAEHLLVLRAQLDDREAWTTLFGRYNARLLYYLRRLVGPDRAEDVLQEVWVTAVRKLRSLRTPEAFRAWIYRIAHNRAMSRLRRRDREVPLEELPPGAEPATEDGPLDEPDEATAFAGVDPAALQRGLDELSGPHRAVLTLRFVEELSYEEIAEVVGCGVGTVRSRLHYAKRTLKQKLRTPSPTESMPSGLPRPAKGA